MSKHVNVADSSGRQLTMEDALKRIMKRGVEAAERAIDKSKAKDGDAARIYEGELRKTVPVDTGALKKSIVAVTKRKGKGLETEITIDPYGKYYGNFVQDGRWVERARKKAEPKILEMYNKQFDEELK